MSASTAQDYLDTARQLAQWAMPKMSGHRLDAADVDTKTSAADYVTVVDRSIEEHVRQVLADRFPEDRIVGEEMGVGGGDGPHSWYVDPVDGTTNYVFGLGVSSFSLAVADEKGPIAGVVADPWRGEVFSAARGLGAWVDDRPAHCTPRTTLTGGILLTEWAAYRAWDGMHEMLADLAGQSCAVRILGSSALTLANAAVGRASGAVLGGYNTYDVLGAVIVAREAGASLLARDGSAAPAIPSNRDAGLLVAAPGVEEPLWRAWTGPAAR